MAQLRFAPLGVPEDNVDSLQVIHSQTMQARQQAIATTSDVAAGPDGIAGTRRQSFAIAVQQAAVCRPVLTAGINKKQLALPVVAGLIQR